MPTIEDVSCDKATYRPSEAAYVTVAMANEQDADFAGSLVLTVTHLDRTIVHYLLCGNARCHKYIISRRAHL